MTAAHHSDENHLFNVSLFVRAKSKRQCPQTTTFEERGEPKRIRTEVPLLTSLSRREGTRDGVAELLWELRHAVPFVTHFLDCTFENLIY